MTALVSNEEKFQDLPQKVQKVIQDIFEFEELHEPEAKAMLAEFQL